MKPRVIGFCVVLFAGLTAVWPLAGQGSEATGTPPPAEQARPVEPGRASYVVLVALEGLRWDDAQRNVSSNLRALARHGAWAPQGMLPSYPAERLPDLYTMVTGLYPGHHGVVADSFFDPARQARFSAADPKTAADGSWYGGVPIWALAERQGVATACIAWPGCAAEIAGARPKYFAAKSADPDVAVRQLLRWLRMPAAERPRLVLAAFDEPERAAREFGPGAPETLAAVRKTDALIGKLKSALDATRLPIDLVIVSDRGLAKTDGGWLSLDQFADLAGFNTAGTLLYAGTEQGRERAYNQLKKATSQFVAYRLKNAPAGLHLNQNPRMGDPVAIATGPYAMRARSPAAGSADAPPRGVAGFDPRFVPEMKAVFIAVGPDIVEGKPVAPFDSVHLYPWLAHLLGFIPPKTDGSLNILSGTLRDGGDETGNRD